jgi:hypothetical protein
MNSLIFFYTESNTMRKLLAVLIIFIILIFGIISLFNVFSLPSKQLKVDAVELLPVDEEKALNKLSKAIKLRTTPSTNDSIANLLKQDIELYLKKSFPNIHNSANVKFELLEDFLIYKWQGLNQRLKPILFVGDLLVEEPELEKLTAWAYSPFMGKNAEAHIWGAGTMGPKSATIAALEAWEQLISDQQIPERSLFFAIRMGKDSINASNWKDLVSSFQKSNIELEAIYGCASYINTKTTLGIEMPIAWLNFAKQNQLALLLKSKDKDALLADMQKLEKNTALAIKEDGLCYQSFRNNLLPELPFKEKWFLSNSGLIGNWMEEALKKEKALKALLYSEIEISPLLEKDSLGVYKQPVLIRLHPETDVTLFKEKFELEVQTYEIEWGSLAYTDNFCSTNSGYSFEVLQTTIKQCLNNPLLMPAVSTESDFIKDFHQLNPNCYQFTPYTYNEEDQILLESRLNHRLSHENYIQAIGFYHQLLRNILL